MNVGRIKLISFCFYFSYYKFVCRLLYFEKDDILYEKEITKIKITYKRIKRNDKKIG